MEMAEQGEGKAPDLVLLDINLPKKMVTEVLDSIKDYAKVAHTFIAMCSGSTSCEDFRRARCNGANAYLLKPMGLEEMEDIITRLREHPSLTGCWIKRCFNLLMIETTTVNIINSTVKLDEVLTPCLLEGRHRIKSPMGLLFSRGGRGPFDDSSPSLPKSVHPKASNPNISARVVSVASVPHRRSIQLILLPEESWSRYFYWCRG